MNFLALLLAIALQAPSQSKAPAPAPAPAPKPSTPAPASQPPAQQQAKPPSQPPAASAPAPAPRPATPPPAPTPAPAPAPPAPAATPAPPPPVETYTYRAEGRRDPFQSLIGAGTPVSASRRGDGPAAMTTNEISVRGVLQSRGALVAMIEGPDKKTYIVHAGDKLLDGTIKTITPQGLVVVQEVNDPLSLVKQREVRKLLRSLEDAK